MLVKTVQLKNFKRFDDLTINLGESPKKIIALVGPNGSGKSSVFDGFEECAKNFYGGQHEPEFASKSFYFPGGSKTYSKREAVNVIPASGTLSKTSFYIRTAYRYTSSLGIDSIKKLSAAIDEARPANSIQLDSRAQKNYERLMGGFVEEVFGKDKTGKQWADENLGVFNGVLEKILDIKISNLGNITEGRGQLWFEKGKSKDFPYMNLSSGEKEVIDIVLDLIIKKKEFNDTIFCIDEPELHLNTAIQRKLLVEIEKLIPDNCQLWVATHSIGFLRALQEDLKDKTAVIDFTGKDFDAPVVLSPILGTRKDWMRIFETALEDLTGLLAPKVIVYCEGRPDPSATGTEQGLDADIYNQVFSETHHDTLFVSSGGGGAMGKNALLALKILNKAFNDVNLFILKDRDQLTDADRATFLGTDAANRMLERREIENYIFDKEILKSFCNANSKTFDEARYDSKVTEIKLQDLKGVQQDIQACCDHSGVIADFKRDLSKFATKDTNIYKEMTLCIFQDASLPLPSMDVIASTESGAN